jgi:hypothetical protein
MEAFFDELSDEGKSLRTEIFLDCTTEKCMKSRGLLAYLIYTQFFKQLVDTGDILSLQVDLSRADYFKNGEKL